MSKPLPHRGLGPCGSPPGVKVSFGTSRTSCEGCAGFPKLCLDADHLGGPRADLLSRDEAANDRKVHARLLAIQTREACRCCGPTPIVPPGNGRVRGNVKPLRHL